MKSFLLRPVFLCFCVSILTLQQTSVQAQTFSFTAIPDQDITRLKQRFERVSTYLESKLDIDVKYIPVKSYSAAISAFRNNQVQLAWFGGLSGVQARRLVPNSNAIAQGEEDQYFKSLIIANASTGLTPSNTLPAVNQKLTLTFGSKSSTSGRLMPEYYLQQHYGKPSNDIFRLVGFSGDHSRTIALVQSGAYDLGAVNFKVWQQHLKEKLVDTNKVNVIWQSPTYPDYQWTIRGDVDQHWGPGFTKKMTDTLLGIDDPEILSAFPRTKFVPAKSEDYDVILTTAKTVGLID